MKPILLSILLCLVSLSSLHAGILSHYTFDSNYTDSSVNARHGTLTDVATPGNSGITTTPGDFKFGGGALNLGADHDYVAIPSSSFASGMHYSIAFWAKKAPGDTGESAQFDMVIGEAGTNVFFLSLSDKADGATGRLGLRWRGSSTSESARQANFNAPDDTAWHHYAFIASGTTLSCYVDGVLGGTVTGALTGFTFNAIGDAYLTSNDFDFNGQIDEMWIFDEALTPAKIIALRDTNNPDLTPVTKLRVVLMGGQSNTDGRAVPGSLPLSPVNLQATQTDVDFFQKAAAKPSSLGSLRPGLSETSQFGPEITLGRRLADLWAGETGTHIALVKYAKGGTNLAVQWAAGGDATTTGDGPEYLTFQQTMTQGLAALAARYPGVTIEVQGMVWLQGESDAIAGYAPAYQENLTRFIADIRATYPRLPFVVARLSSGQTNLAATYLNQVRAAQDAVAAADPLTGIITTDGLGLAADNLHFNADGQQAIGYAFAGEFSYLEWMSRSFTPAQIDDGLGAPDADPDADGIKNRWEYAAGSDPAVSVLTQDGLPLVPAMLTVSQDDQHYTQFTYLRRIDSSMRGLRFTLETSPTMDPGTWSIQPSSEIAPLVPTGDGITELCTLRSTAPIPPSPPHLFTRLGVVTGQ